VAAATCSMSFAAETAYTTPVGYVTQALAANTVNLIGQSLLNPTLASGSITSVNGATVSDSNLNFTNVLPTGKMCVLDVITGSAAGTVQEFVTWSNSSVTLPATITGLASGDIYKIRAVSNLVDIFPVGFLTGSAIPGNADKVWVPNGTGGYNKYWYRVTIAPTGWRTTTTGLNDTGAVVGDIPLPYIDGIIVEKKSASQNIVMFGEVKKTPSNTLAIVGVNPITVVSPVGLTLLTSGLQSQITGSAIPGNADKVWVPNGLGGYTKYWNRVTIAPTGWRTTTTGLNDTGGLVGDVALSNGIYIERKSSPKVLQFSVPASYSNL
jgi:hypothetical protein